MYVCVYSFTTKQDEVNESNENVSESTQLAESTTAELNALEPSLCNNDSSDDLFRQLSESNFEIESLLSDLATVEVKVKYFPLVLLNVQQQFLFIC